jgi:hypothetical protein
MVRTGFAQPSLFMWLLAKYVISLYGVKILVEIPVTATSELSSEITKPYKCQ